MVDYSSLYDLIVIGGGVVGLAVLRAATLEGWNCVLVEAESDLLAHASGSNSGIVCTGVDASPGTLERALIRDSISNFRLYCREHNLPTRPCGSLVCLWPWDEVDNLSVVLEESHDAGDTHATQLTSLEVLRQEPNLASSCRGAVHIPGEVLIDPWLYSISLAAHARENGAEILTNFCVDAEACSLKDGVWTVVSKDKDSSSLTHHPTKKLRAKMVVNAAGIWADMVQAKGHGANKWTAKPRRGQYRVYDASDSTMITHPIQPIPSQRTKGIFIFSTLYNQLVVGPTALDQTSRTDRSVDPQVAKELDSIIQRVIPDVDVQRAYVGDYVGIRPGTDKRDYQIHLFPREHWIAVAGIRSTGLTASLGIGNYVVRHLRSVLDEPESKKDIKTTPMPQVSDLVRDFHENKGYVFIHGHRYRVTHPLTRFGLQSKKGVASPQRSKL
jgi:glycerol-3-phosphate dehydrogenase